MKKAIAEFIGTFVLVFMGTGAIVLNEYSNGSVTHLGVSFAFGLAVFLMILAFGKISRAHINPMVSIAMWLNGKLKFSELITYLTAQLSGAIVASTFLGIIFFGNHNLGATLPAGSQMESFYLEILLSYILMQAIFIVVNKKMSVSMIALIVGFIVFLEAFIAGPITGASMNPARSIGPALVSGNVASLWIYIYAPVIGSIVATLINFFFKHSRVTKRSQKLKTIKLQN